MLPIVQRDLRVSARNPKLYARRVRWGVLQIVAAVAVLLITGGGFQRAAAQTLFGTLCGLALMFCLLEGVRKTSDAISSEKREGTLGFLFLSTLSGADVAFGKFCGALIRSLSVLLPFLPILALSLLVGGTTLGEFWRVAVALIATLALSLSLCVFMSSVTWQKSIGAALSALALVCFLPLFAQLAPPRLRWASLISPFKLLGAAKEWPYSRNPQDFWIALGAAMIGSAIWMAGASFFVTRTWQQRGTAKEKGATLRKKRSRKRRELLEKNPVLWLNYDQRGSVIFSIVSVVLLTLGIAGLLMAYVFELGEFWLGVTGTAGIILCLAIWLRVGVQASTWLAEAKRDGSLGLLLTTPLSVNEIMRGYFLALWRMIRVPVFCLAPFLLGLAAATSQDQGGSWVAALTFFLGMPLGIVTFGAVGIWMGLTAKSRATAVALTLLLGWAIPSMFCTFLLPVQIGLVFGAFYKSKEILNRMRTGGDPSDLRSYLRVPGSATPGVPPVIRHAAPPVIK